MNVDQEARSIAVGLITARYHSDPEGFRDVIYSVFDSPRREVDVIYALATYAGALIKQLAAETEVPAEAWLASIGRSAYRKKDV